MLKELNLKISIYATQKKNLFILKIKFLKKI